MNEQVLVAKSSKCLRFPNEFKSARSLITSCFAVASLITKLFICFSRRCLWIPETWHQSAMPLRQSFWFNTSIRLAVHILVSAILSKSACTNFGALSKLLGRANESLRADDAEGSQKEQLVTSRPRQYVLMYT